MQQLDLTAARRRWNYYSGCISLALHRVSGRPFRVWYAKYVDASAASSDSRWLAETEVEVGQMQVRYLAGNGMEPHHRLLDFGCGNLRGGIPLIAYLNAGGYVGVDISQARLDFGRQRVVDAGLADKAPQLLHVQDLSMRELNGITFDYIWSMSVLCHMPLSDISLLFQSARRLMHRDSVFLASYSDGGGVDSRPSIKDWFHAFDTLAAEARKYGFTVEQDPTWRHPDSRNPSDRMLRLRLA